MSGPYNNAVIMSLEKETPMFQTGQENFQIAEEEASRVNSI